VGLSCDRPRTAPDSPQTVTDRGILRGVPARCLFRDGQTVRRMRPVSPYDIMLTVQRVTRGEKNHAGERGDEAMHARMSTLEGSPGRLDEGVHDIREDVLPQLRQQDGFKGFLALGDRQSGKLVGITFWESEQAMRAAEEVGDRSRRETAEDIGDTIEDVERFEVGLFEMSG